jgi:glycogen(starch) synthase
MRILMTTDTLGGVFTYSVELIRGLQQLGVDVVLATTGRRLSPAQRAALSELANLEVHETSGALEWMDEPWADVAVTGRWLLDLADRCKPDCVHLNELAHAALPWRAPVIVVGHSCVLSWWEAVLKQPAPPRYRRYVGQVVAALAAADAIVAPSAAMLGALDRHYGPLRASQVIPNGIALRRFAPAAKQPCVVTAGRLWDQAKNVAALQRTAAALPWPVQVAGDAIGPDGQDQSQAAAPCQLLGNLPRPELASVMARAAIYALPARYEPFGLSVLEAAASGCALVLGRIPSLLENWSGAARFVDPDQPDELRQTLLELIEQPSVRAELSAKAHERAQRFGAEPMAKAYLQLYAAVQPTATKRRQARCAS